MKRTHKHAKKTVFFVNRVSFAMLYIFQSNGSLAAVAEKIFCKFSVVVSLDDVNSQFLT